MTDDIEKIKNRIDGIELSRELDRLDELVKIVMELELILIMIEHGRNKKCNGRN